MSSKDNFKYIITKTVVINDEETIEKYKIVNEDDEVFSDSYSTKGAVIGAMAVGISLRDINFNGHWVPIKDCIKAVQ